MRACVRLCVRLCMRESLRKFTYYTTRLLSAHFDQAATVASVVLDTTLYASDQGSNAALGKQLSLDYPINVLATTTLFNATRRYQKISNMLRQTLSLGGGLANLLLHHHYLHHCHCL